ncbi:MAG: SIS domain-containing protein, partial [Nannocystaceae bacterium]
MAAEKQGYKHFMLKEIHEQSKAIRDTILGHLDGDALFSGRAFPTPGPNGRVLLLACGTSWHAALCGKMMIEKLTRIPAEVDLASEFRYREPVVRAGDIAIAVSQSGETADTLAAIKEAKRLGAKTFSIC